MCDEWKNAKQEKPTEEKLVYFVSELGAKFIGKYNYTLEEWFSNDDYLNPIDKHFNIILWTELPEIPEK